MRKVYMYFMQDGTALRTPYGQRKWERTRAANRAAKVARRRNRNG